MTDPELIDGIDGDSLPERLYNIKGSESCIKCGRALKGKIAYLTLSNDLICKDTGNSATPSEAIMCEVFQTIKKPLLSHGVRLPKNTIKKLERALKEVLEI